MNYIELKVNGKRINLYGTKAIIEKEKNIIEQLNLSGNEQKDRLIIQKCIDENKLKSDILYDGNTVYPFEKTIKAYRKMQKTDSLENMSNYMYHFFTNACGDIAHYDIQGFRGYYNYSLRNLENILLKNNNFISSKSGNQFPAFLFRLSRYHIFHPFQISWRFPCLPQIKYFYGLPIFHRNPLQFQQLYYCLLEMGKNCSQGLHNNRSRCLLS